MISYMLLVKLGLFDRAIAQSGSATCPWATQDSSTVEYSKQLVDDLNCPSSSPKMVKCLQRKNVTDILNFEITKGRVYVNIYWNIFFSHIYLHSNFYFRL